MTELRNILKSYSLIPGFYEPNPVSSMLVNVKDPVPANSKSGVYKLSCPDCPAVYIGETSRKFSKRFKEHEDAYKKSKERESTFADHLMEYNHRFDANLCKPLRFESHYRRRLVLEDMEIYQHMGDPGNRVINRSINEHGLIPIYLDTSRCSEKRKQNTYCSLRDLL